MFLVKYFFLENKHFWFNLPFMHAYIKHLLLHSCTMHFTQAHTVIMHINYGLRAQFKANLEMLALN